MIAVPSTSQISQPQELASGADAIKFDGTLDRIDLVPISIDAVDTAPSPWVRLF